MEPPSLGDKPPILLTSSDFMLQTSDDFQLRLSETDLKLSSGILSTSSNAFYELRSLTPEPLKNLLTASKNAAPASKGSSLPFTDGSAEAALLQQELQRQADEQRALEEQQALQLAYHEQQRHEAEQAHAMALAQANAARAAAAVAPAATVGVAPHATILAPSPVPAAPLTPSALPAQQRAGEPSPTQLLEVLSQIRLKQRDKLEEIRLIQRRIAAAPTPEYLQLLLAQQTELRNRLEQELSTLDRLLQTVLLCYSDLMRFFALKQELRTQKLQLEIYFQELQQLAGPTRCVVAALTIVDQPFPTIIMRQKQLEEPLTIQLLAGATVSFQPMGPLRGVLTSSVTESVQTTLANVTMPLESDSMTFDIDHRIAHWYLKPVNGSRKGIVYARFALQLLAIIGPQSHPIILESPVSNPFIILTNDVQWDETEGVLIRKYVFQDQPEVPWLLLANVLQRQFVRGTRQDPSNPIRPLSPAELMYIHRQFFQGHPMVTQQAFVDFWEWFGKGVQKLRSTRPLLALWNSGLIYGYISSEELQPVVQHEEPGSFVIRFSDKHPGQLVIHYRSNEDPRDPVKQYLIRTEDLKEKTLPDFLAEQTGLIRILQLVVVQPLQSGGGAISNHATLRRVPRDMAFGAYYSVRKSPARDPEDVRPPARTGRKFLSSSNATDLTFVTDPVADPPQHPGDE